MASEYRQHGFHKITPWKTKTATIPPTYNNPKHANPLEKGRPIRDCSRQAPRHRQGPEIGRAHV